MFRWKLQPGNSKFEPMAHNFPEEIILDILFRLPPKTLIRCTSVCKSWNSMIKNPSFIRTHLNRTIDLNNQFGTHLRLVYCARIVKRSRFRHGDLELLEEQCNLYSDNLAFDEYCKLEFPIAPREELRNKVLDVVSVCNGLVLLADNKVCSGNTFILCNPSMRKSVTLPKPHYTFKGDPGYYYCMGFGFDAVTNDYKVVRITIDHREDQDPSTFYEVYSLAGGSWSDPCFLDHVLGLNNIRKPTAFVNGVIHWDGWRRLTNGGSECFILAFDVGSDSFRSIVTPKDFRRLYSEHLCISGYGKSIALSHSYYTEIIEPRLDIWVMKEYGLEESWTKLITLCPPGPEGQSLYQPLWFRKSGDVVLVLTKSFVNDDSRHELVCLDLVSKQYTNLGIHGYRYYYAESYVESLVLLDKTDAVSY
ncbi:F-box protein CPR1-like [Pyrus communis]|uniref:F-box protein CPR1-like n=1 Tax=Pyrus communis TaxID=23211 RepID=UPI0035C0D29A